MKKDATGSERAKRLYDKRKEAGKVKLGHWVSEEARNKLERLARKADKSPAEYLEELIQRA